MSFRVFLVLLVFAVNCSAQVMNVRKWRQTERDTLDNALALVDEGYYARALPHFEHLLGGHPDETFLKYSYAKCALQRGDRQYEAYPLLQEVYGKNKKVPDILYDMALGAYHRFQFAEAEKLLSQYVAGKKISDEARRNAARLREYITHARTHLSTPGRSRISALGDAVNSEYNEHSPAIDAVASMLTFAQSSPRSTGGLQYEELGEEIRSFTYFDDVMMTRRKDRVFKPSAALDSLNTMLGDKVVALSADGRRALVHLDVGDGHGDLFESYHNGYFFVPTTRLKGTVNGYSGEYHAALSPDGQTIFFSSDRPGGKGGRDIYRATLVGDTVWTNVQNLGDSVNTGADEDTPFLFHDGRTLFFSSKGRNSMGGYDIFMTTMNADTTFSGTINLGYPVNGTSDDLSFVLAADGRNGFFSSARKDGMGMEDIYQVDVVLPSAPGPVYVARGKVSAASGPVKSSVLVECVSGVRRRFTRAASDSATGEFLLALPQGEKYEILYSHPSYLTASLSIDTRGLTAYSESTHDIALQAVPVATLPIASVNSATGAVAGDSGITPLPVEATVTTAGVKPWAEPEDFSSMTLLQKKTIRYMERYGNVSAPGLQFCVQFAAVKGKANMYFPKLARYGRVERLQLNDGFTRLTVGGKFTTLNKAFSMNRKAIRAGQKEAFVIALYNGKRVQYEELEKIGVFK